MRHLRAVLHTPQGSRRYGSVLTLTAISVIFQMAAPDRPGYRITSALLQVATLFLALHASDISRRERRFVAVLAGLAVATAIGGHAGSGSDSSEAGIAFVASAVLVALTLSAIGRGVVADLLEERAVTLHAVLGVVCVYLMIGVLLSFCYGAIAAFGDQPFFAQGLDGDHADQLYFSYITQTTVGYGDYTPAGRFGRSLAAFQALLGQIYLVTIVALMVSNLRPRARAA